MKKLLICLLVLLFAAAPALAETYVYDPSDVFTGSEISAFERRMAELCDKHGIDLLLAVTDDSDGYHAYDYAPLLYAKLRRNNPHPDYAVVVVCLDNRTYGFDGEGRLGSAMNAQYGADAIESILLPYLSSGDYSGAMNAWLDVIEDVCVPQSAFSAAGELFPFVLIVAALIALITVLTMKSSLKTARFSQSAGQYIDKNSLHLTSANEFFLYQTVHRTRIQRSSSSGGGSRGSGGGGGSSCRGGGSF